jgi:signal transduction histidine kinase/CheY-like chemotaxis protein
MPRLNALPRIGLRQLLIALSLAGIVPLAIVATVLLVALWRAQQAELHESLRASAHTLAVSVEQRLDSTRRRLDLLASLEPSAEALARRRGEILAANPDWSGVTIGATPTVSGLEVGVPVVRHGKVAFGLVATLSRDDLSTLLRAQLRDTPRVAEIVDAEGRSVARTRDPGAELYSARAPIPGTRWTLVLGTPAAPADAALSRSLAALAALLVLVLVASSLFAWLIGRRLADAIHAAATAAAVISAGGPAHAVPSRIEELHTLMEALKRASARLAAAEAERAHTASEGDRVLAEESRARTHAEAASRAKDEFLAMLGHELRNPLGAIGNAMRVIERLPASSADYKAAREILARQTAHLAKIVDDLLDVGRLVSGRILLKRNLVDLAQAAAASVAAARAGDPGRAHEWKLELATVLVSADPTRIDQVLANLIGNAAKFTPAGGEIRVRLRQEAGEALLSVEDTGPGIRPELLPHIFDLFSKDITFPEGGGLGIGLSLVKRLVELHGGSVTAENIAPGRGARFSVRLPAIPEPEPVAQREARSLPAPRPARQARVLIVEDNDDARVSLQRILQADGHLVSAARDARAGLDAAMAGSPNVAVVDIGLPGMDGYEFARALRERLGSGIRLIALTGYGTSADRKRSADAGFDAHLTKPVDLDRLLALITESAA